MYRASLRNVLAHKGRLVMTMLAVLLGTAFVAGTLVFSDSVGQSFKDSMSNSYSGVSVRAIDQAVEPNHGPKGRFTHPTPLTDAIVAKVKALPGASDVRGTLTGFAGLADPHGDLIGRAGDTRGGNWVPDDSGKDWRYPMVSGAGPSGPDSVAIDQKTAADRHFKVGDTVRLAVTGPVRQMRVSGIFHTDDPQVRSGGSLVLFDTPTAQSLYDEPGKYGAIDAATRPGVTEAQLLAQIKKAVPDDSNIKVETVTQMKDDDANIIATATTGLKVVLLSFAAIALFVGVFLISNTFTMLIAQRTRELALLRALGAGRRQVRRSVLLEAFLIGASASAAGLVTGIGIGFLMQSVMAAMGTMVMTGSLVVSPTTVVVTLLTGTLVTVLSALLPSRRASRVAPVAAMNGGDIPATQKSLIVRNTIGWLTTVGGVAAIVGGSAGHGGNARHLVMLGAVATMVGVFILTPLLSRPVIGAIGPLYARLFGVSGKLARRNAVRNPRRTAATASALTVGIALISMLTTVGVSASTAVDKQVSNGMKADYEVTATLGQSLSPTLLPAITKAPGVAAVSAVDSQPVTLPQPKSDPKLPKVPDLPFQINGVDTSVISQLLTPQMVSGSASALAAGQWLVEQAQATRSGWTVGSKVDVTFPDGFKTRLTVGGIFQTSQVEGQSLLSEAVLKPHAPQPSYNGILVKGVDGASAGLRQALKDATGDNPLILVETRKDLQNDFNYRFTLMLEIMYGLLGMAVVIAILGVVNTLAMSVFERRREIGVLRAVGLDRTGVRRMIRLESVVIAAFGAVLGVAIGLLLAWAVVRMFVETLGDLTTVVPYGRLAMYVASAAVVGLVAAIWPARSATRTGVLEGISAG